MPFADEDITASAGTPDHFLRCKLPKDVLRDFVQALHRRQTVATKLRLQKIGADHVDAVFEFGKQFPDYVRFTDPAWADDANSSRTKRHVVLVACDEIGEDSDA